LFYRQIGYNGSEKIGFQETTSAHQFHTTISFFELSSPSLPSQRPTFKAITMRLLLLILSLFLSFDGVAQKFENLAQTPPMGWNSWNTFATEIDEDLIKEIADKFVELGLKDAGYEYVVLDDAWMAMERDENGNLIGDPERFPSGMKALGDYIHSKGLKFGLYNCAGWKTCQNYDR
jgi:alpha-galactosidase